jgi:hypothetical protein
VKAKAVVAAVALLAGLSVLVGSARADIGESAGPSVTCSAQLSPGSLHIACTTSDGAVFECQLSFSWAAGVGLSCSGPNGSLTCSSRPIPSCTVTKDGVTTTYLWRR